MTLREEIDIAMANDDSFHNPIAAVLNHVGLTELAKKYEFGNKISDVSESLTVSERKVVCKAVQKDMNESFDPKLECHLEYLLQLYKKDVLAKNTR
jgi:hypothetical protein